MRTQETALPTRRTMSLKAQPQIRFTPKVLNQEAKKAQPTQEMLDLGIQNSSDSAFFNLPGDTRKRIYEYVFTAGEVIQLLPLNADLERETLVEKEEEEDETMNMAMDMELDIDEMMMVLDINDTFDDLSLTNNAKTKTRNPFTAILTSRQFYLETHLLPFYHNNIYCSDMGYLAAILRRLSSVQTSSIRVLKIQWATAHSAVREYTNSSGEFGPVGSALRMLGKVERVVVDWAGKRRLFPDENTVGVALSALGGRKLFVLFERVGEEYRVDRVQRREEVQRADTVMDWVMPASDK